MSWRNLIGFGYEDIWRQFATQLDGTFTQYGWTANSRIDARWREWAVTLDRCTSNDVQYTRLRAPFLALDGFRFRLYREGFFTPMGKKLGLTQDIETGHARFDEAWVVQGNDEARVRSLLAQARVRELVDALPFDLDFQLKDDKSWLEPLPEGVDILSLTTRETLGNLEQLRQLYELFGEVLDWLVSRNLARRGDTGVSL